MRSGRGLVVGVVLGAVVLGAGCATGEGVGWDGRGATVELADAPGRSERTGQVLEATTASSSPRAASPPASTVPASTPPPQLDPPPLDPPPQPAPPPLPDPAPAPPAPAVPASSAEVLALIAGTAPAPPGGGDVRAAALDMVRVDWQRLLPGWELRFVGARSGYRGATFPASRLIEIYPRPGDSAASLAHVVAHEVAHALDVTYFTDAHRSAWRSARGLPADVPWFAASGGADFATGAGDFAESFAWWQATTGHWFGELGPPPTVAQMALMSVLTGAG